MRSQNRKTCHSKRNKCHLKYQLLQQCLYKIYLHFVCSYLGNQVTLIGNELFINIFVHFSRFFERLLYSLNFFTVFLFLYIKRRESKNRFRIPAEVTFLHFALIPLGKAQIHISLFPHQISWQNIFRCCQDTMVNRRANRSISPNQFP